MAERKTIAIDTFKNFAARLGTSRDKQSHGDYYLQQFSDQQLSTIYRTSWMARKLIDIPAEDATREWRDWKADAGQIEKLEALEQKLLLRQKVKKALQLARLYGGSGIYMSIRNDDPSLPLDFNSIGADDLEFVTVLSSDILVAGEVNLDPMEAGYGQPEYYELTGQRSGMTRVHASRVCRFIGNEVPKPEEAADVRQGWADSILQAAYEAVRNADSTASNIASLVYEAKIDVLQIPNLADIMADPHQRALLVARVELAAQIKGNNGMLIVDGEEEYSQKNFTFAGLPDINHQALQAVSGAADIPITRFLGQSPAGMSSTGESDLRNYYDAVGSEQRLTITPTLTVLDEVLIRSALGSRPEDVYYEWASLWQMSDTEKSKISKETADTIKILADTGLFPEDALSIAAANMLIEHSNLPEMEFTPEDLEEQEPEIDLNPDEEEL